MKVTVVECPCRNPMRHVKFQDEEGGKTNGVFSLTEGRRILEELKKAGRMSAAEVAETDAELVAAGLPEYPAYSDQELDALALEIFGDETLSGEYDKVIALNIKMGKISPTDAERLREMIRQFAKNPETALQKLLEKLARLAQL